MGKKHKKEKDREKHTSKNVNLTFVEIELASDVKNFISFNNGAYSNEEIKEEVFKFNDDDLLKVTKNIASPIKIIKVEKITEDLINKAL